ncbi:MAG: DinB family protein [Fibrobacteria bacterium]
MNAKPIDLDAILATLKNGPGMLQGLMAVVPEPMRRLHRIPGKWCIHAHACHIVDVQPMLIGRLRRFLDDPHPVFVPYIPDGESGEAPLLAMDLRERLAAFPALRAEMVELIRSAPASFWEGRAEHPEYADYSPAILARHIMMHDHLHMYRIEELWLTRDAYLRGVARTETQ